MLYVPTRISTQLYRGTYVCMHVCMYENSLRHEQHMTQGQFLSVLNLVGSFPPPRLFVLPRLKNPV